MKPPSLESEQAEFYLLWVLELTELTREAEYSNLSMHLNTAIYLKAKNATALTIGSKIFYEGKQGKEDVPAWPPPGQQHRHCCQVPSEALHRARGLLPEPDDQFIKRSTHWQRSERLRSALNLKGQSPLTQTEKLQRSWKPMVLYTEAKGFSNHYNVSSSFSQELRWFTFLLRQILNWN